MTVLVGILCKDGVVIGADSAATFSAGQQRTIEQPTKKLRVIADTILVAGTGQVGLGQRFCEIVSKAWTDKVFQQAPVEVGKVLCSRTVQDFASTNAPKGSYGALVAFPSGGKMHLCEFAVADFQPELKTEHLWYVSMGGGQSIADPLLGLMRDAFWDDGLPYCNDAEFVVTWVLTHAIKMNPGGVNGPAQIAVLKSEGGKAVASILDQPALDGHQENVDGLAAHMRSYRDTIRGTRFQVGIPAAPSLGQSAVQEVPKGVASKGSGGVALPGLPGGPPLK